MSTKIHLKDLVYNGIIINTYYFRCICIYKWAESKGRNAVIWAIAAALVSPLIVGIILLFVPKTLEKQAEEAKRLKELMNE